MQGAARLSKFIAVPTRHAPVIAEYWRGHSCQHLKTRLLGQTHQQEATALSKKGNAVAHQEFQMTAQTQQTRSP